MILRRVTEHVRAQNWSAVALDFFIVVVGVGVAMLGQQWLSDRQQRADMAVAETALQSYFFELQTDIYALQARSKVLAVDTKLGQSDRLRYYDMLAEMDEKSGLLEVDAEQMIPLIEEIGIEIPLKYRPMVLKTVTSEVEESKAIYGDCYQPQKWPVLDAYLKKAKTP